VGLRQTQTTMTDRTDYTGHKITEYEEIEGVYSIHKNRFGLWHSITLADGETHITAATREGCINATNCRLTRLVEEKGTYLMTEEEKLAREAAREIARKKVAAL